MVAVTFHPVAFRFTQLGKNESSNAQVLLRRGTIILEPEIKTGARHGGYKAPDTFEHWNIELDLPRFSRWIAWRYLRRNAHIALEFWTEDVVDNGESYIHWLFPSLRWKRKMCGRTFTGSYMPRDDPAPDGMSIPAGGFWRTGSIPSFQ